MPTGSGIRCSNRCVDGDPANGRKQAPPIQDTLAEMDRAGVSVGMLCAWHGPGGPMISNDEVAQYCRAYPDRFIGIASVDLFRPMEAVRELRLRVKRDGFKGLRVLPWVWGLPPDDRRYYPLFAECCELDVPFCTQVGHAGPLREVGTRAAYPLSRSGRTGVSRASHSRWPYRRAMAQRDVLTRYEISERFH